MLRNYLRVAFRNISGEKGYSFLNIFGMAVGLACCILTALYVLDELSYDEFFPNKDRIVRLVQTSISSTKEEPYASVPFKAGPMLEEEYPSSVKKIARFYDMREDTRTIRYAEEDLSFSEEHFYFADSTALELFDIAMAEGDAATALDAPGSIVVTEETARRYFGDGDPMGKTLSFKGVMDLTVTGVMEELPRNSHLRFDLLASFSSLPALFGGQPYNESWYSNPVWTYVLLEEGAGRESLEAQLPGFADKYYHPNRPENERVELALQPITDIHLWSDYGEEMNPTGSIFHVRLFSGIAFLVLLIGCINFVNLSTARAMERAREVGMRKVLGADRRQLFGQFMGESLLMAGAAVVLAALMAKAGLPWLNDFIGRSLEFRPLADPRTAASLAGAALAVGFLSGLYPAVFLSRFEPARILRGYGTRRQKGSLFRKGLVVFQFAMSVALIIGTAVIYLQLDYMQNRDLGYDRERVALLPVSQTLIAWEYDRFRELAVQSTAVAAMSGTELVLGADEENFYMFRPASGNGGASNSNPALYVTHGFLETYDIPVLAGRGFSREYQTDGEQAVMVNESMLNQMEAETPAEAVGAQFYLDSSTGERKTFTVIGVVPDFNHTTLRKEVGPLVLRVVDETTPIVQHIEHVAVKLAPGRTQEGIAALRSAWEEVNYIDPFRYSFHEDELEEIYSSERRMASLSGIFTLLCIAVACLGLLGLASYSTSQRTREIGLRKTMGATVTDILALLSGDYLKLIVLANILAWPVIWYVISGWLRNFPYHIAIGWKMAAVFLLTGAASAVICLLTVSGQSLRAALMNPVDSIRQE